MFAAKLKDKRNGLKLTQNELAERLHVSRSLVAKWEQGRAIPTKSSLDDMCALFSCREEDLLDYNDVDKNIKSNNKSHRNSLIIIGVISAVALSAIGAGIYLGVNNANKDSQETYTLKTNELFSSAFLSESGLNFLPMISKKEGTDSYLASFFSSSSQYVATVQDKAAFSSYILELYSYLRGNPYISSLSSCLQHPEDNWRNSVTGRFSNNFNDYLLPMEGVNEFSIFPFESSQTYVNYSFYYIKDLKDNHQVYEAVDPYKITVEYYAEPATIIGIKGEGESEMAYAKGNFSLSIVHLTSSHYKNSVTSESDDSSSKIEFDSMNYYLLQERYDIKRVEINGDNYQTYLPIEERNDDSGGKSLWIASSGPYSPFFRLDGSIDYSYLVDGSKVNGTEKFTFGVGYPFHLFSLPKDYSHSYSDLTLNNLDVQGGYFYELTRKEGAPDPYPDRAYYL